MTPTSDSDPPVTIRHTVSGGDYGTVQADNGDVVTIVETGAPTLSIDPASASESAGTMSFTVSV